MNSNPLPSKPRRQTNAGFALIASLSIMAVLVLIAVALYTLASVASKSAEIAAARVEAQANARTALMVAVGELQKSMGPDQRISANASILDTPQENPDNEVMDVINPHWVGVWDSWIAGDINDAPVDPAVYPSAQSEHRTIGSPTDTTLEAGMHPNYDEKDKHFRKWLLSLDPDVDNEDPGLATDLSLVGETDPDENSSAVRLIGSGSLGPNALAEEFVSAGLIGIDDDAAAASGRYAWWIGDQSQKATILAESYGSGSSLTDAEQIYRAQAPATMGNRMLSGLENATDESELNKLATFKTLDLISLNPEPGANDPTLSQLNFHNAAVYNYGVLADVREGGLKRDLNTLLERQISLNDDGDEFMLYDFNREGETVLDERVPIQDLAAYYQLYRNEESSFSDGGRGGIMQTSSDLPDRLQIQVPDYGDSSNKDKYLREYTALYRNPIPVKIKFVLGVGASELILTPEQEIEYAGKLRPDDNYKLTLGVMPVISLWNPNNVHMVMSTDSSQEMRVSFPPFAIQWKKYRAAQDADGDFESRMMNLSFSISNESGGGDGRARRLSPYLMSFQFAKDNPIIFEPGEVKMFKINFPENNLLEFDGDAGYYQQRNQLYGAGDFLPFGFFVAAKTSPSDSTEPLDVVDVDSDNYKGQRLVFADGDSFTIAVYPEANGWARNVSRANEIVGGGLQFWMADADFDANYDPRNDDPGTFHFRNYQFISRFGGTNSPDQSDITEFNADLILSGFPNGEVIPFDDEDAAIPGMEIVASTGSDGTPGEVRALLSFTMMPGCEINNSNTGGFSAGRRIATRPFLHGSTLTAPQIAEYSPTALYDYGWEWQVEKVNDLAQAFQDDGTSRGYHGGGYTVEAGTTNIVQQYLPVLPPISIASLSSAHLGGYSLANVPVMRDASDVRADTLRVANELGDFRQTTATGHGGLLPQTLQAVGNSYAHPNLASNQAFTTYTRQMNWDRPASDQIVSYVDHSYLANKALWDDYFFSSITPEYASVELQGEDKSATLIADEFLFSDATLPNRRIVPYTDNLNRDEFNIMADDYAEYTDGFADKIAAHLMIHGPFNVNSTSLDSWKALLTSLRNKSMAYLDDSTGNVAPTTTTDETPVGPGMLPNDQPIPSGTLGSDTNAPINQWTSWRSISDTEINELATAIVEQVKERGPFLSLSEFINRRLDSTDVELAVKGCLQAALDDDDVSINAAFRSDERKLDDEVASLAFEFQEAAQGPIAYGSTPYIDQADILRHLGSVLTPRGDTFVIRTYGDTLDAQGQVIARAWCEAIVQRTPDYLDQSTDENHYKQERLNSDTNKEFGRRFSIISFRWLDEDEV